jgi:hypothetical protein
VPDDFDGLLGVAHDVVRDGPPNPRVLKNIAWAIGEHYSSGRPVRDFVGAPDGHKWDSEWPLLAADRIVHAIDERAAAGLDRADMIHAVRNVLHPGSADER